MNPVIHSEKHFAIVYDADCIPEPKLRLFDPEYWGKSGLITGRASGRGTALMLNTSFGPAVLRTYLRGGWPASLSRDRYFFTGYGRSRPFREFRILEKLKENGLPVPAPLAAACKHELLSYRGALMMEQIQNVTPLLELLGRATPASPVWMRAGACIREFHQVGLHHADLNVGNILVDQSTGKIYLVDFDRCTLNPGMPVNGKANLARLKRSLTKRWPVNNPGSLMECWKALLDGYHG